MYGKLPEIVGNIEIPCKEMLYYQYLPIKLTYNETSTLSELTKICLEPRLEIFRPLINICCHDYIKNNLGIDENIIHLFKNKEWHNTYIYLTVKNQYQKNGCGFNREGWHSDSYKDDDTIYLWANSQPTVFNSSKFILSEDDDIALKEMNEQAKEENNVIYPINSLLKLDQYVIHKVGDIIPGMRCFVKLVFSKNKFNLEGNSHNYEINYNWKMHPRKEKRNIPYVLE